jgi:hypothetical protein
LVSDGEISIRPPPFAEFDIVELVRWTVGPCVYGKKWLIIGQIRPSGKRNPRALIGNPEEIKVTTELHRAAKHGDMAGIAAFATHPEYLEARDKRGQTPIYSAASCGQTEAVKVLASVGADVNAAADGSTSIYVASMNGHESTALASLGANVTTPNRWGETPVYAASEKGHAALVRALASCGATAMLWFTEGRRRTSASVAARALASLRAIVHTAVASVSAGGGCTPLSRRWLSKA